MPRRKQTTAAEGRIANPPKGKIPSGNATLLAEPRRIKILEWLQEEGSARVRDLAESFQVSEVTIRQDLERLENDGHIIREHGGAYLRSVRQQVRSMALHHLVNMDMKRRIGRRAADLVEDGDAIILDSGSTTTELAKQLTEKMHLTVITNALNIALILGANPTNTIHMPGGQFKAPTLSLSGDRSVEYLRGLFAQKLFLATAAVSFDAGLTIPSIADVPIKRAMIEAASTTYLLADSSKIGKTSFSSLCSLDRIDTLITDKDIAEEDLNAFPEAGVDVIIA